MAENLTPAQLPVGSPTDTSVVHASENNVITNSKGHSERDISRLQGTSPLFDAAKTYNSDDLVTESNIVYRSIGGSVAHAFDRAEWDLVNEPARLGAPSTGSTDTSTVIASVNNVVGDTEAHTERDISRLQSSIHEYNQLKDYNEDDLVWFADPDIASDTIVQYRANKDVLGSAIDTVTMPTGILTGYIDLEEVTLTGGPVGSVDAKGIASVLGLDLISVTITEGGGGYGIGNTLTVEGSASGADVMVDTLVNFDSTQWEISDGIGAANVKHVFQESDFPAAIDGFINVKHNVEYLISAPLTINSPLFIGAGFNFMLRAFADEANIVTTNIVPTEPAIKTSGIFGTITNTINQTSPNVLLQLISTSGLVAGQFINFQLDNSTEFLRKEILSVDGGENQIIIDNGGEAVQGGEMGNWDQGALNIELEDIVFQGQANDNFMEVSFAHVLESQGFIFHCNVKSYIGLGAASFAGNLIWDSSDFFDLGFGIILNNNNRSFFSQLSFQDPMTFIADAVFQIGGDETEFVDFSSIVFETNSDLMPNRQFPMYIQGIEAPNPIGDNTQIHLNNCKDINFLDTFFQTTTGSGGGITEADNRVTSNDNGEQKNSLSIAGIELPPTAEVVVVEIPDVGSVGVMLPVNSTQWITEANTERFSLKLNGTQATADAVISGQMLDSFENLVGGDGYLSVPIVTIGPPDTGTDQALASATISSESVNTLMVDDPGDNYTTVPTVTIDAPFTGVFTYDGISDQTFVVTYTSSLASNGQTKTIFGGILLNGTEISSSRIKVSDADDSDIQNIAGTFIILLQPGDELQFGVGNESGFGNMNEVSVSQVVVTATRAG